MASAQPQAACAPSNQPLDYTPQFWLAEALCCVFFFPGAILFPFLAGPSWRQPRAYRNGVNTGLPCSAPAVLTL